MSQQRGQLGSEASRCTNAQCHGDKGAGAMALLHPTRWSSQTCRHTVQHRCLAGVWSKDKALTFVFLEACRPGRKAGTGSFRILWEIMHVSVENEKMKTC